MLSLISNLRFYLTWAFVNLLVAGVVFFIAGIIYSMQLYNKKSLTRCYLKRVKLYRTNPTIHPSLNVSNLQIVTTQV